MSLSDNFDILTLSLSDILTFAPQCVCEWRDREALFVRLEGEVRRDLAAGRLPPVQPFHIMAYPFPADLAKVGKEGITPCPDMRIWRGCGEHNTNEIAYRQGSSQQPFHFMAYPFPADQCEGAACQTCRHCTAEQEHNSSQRRHRAHRLLHALRCVHAERQGILD